MPADMHRLGYTRFTPVDFSGAQAEGQARKRRLAQEQAQEHFIVDRLNVGMSDYRIMSEFYRQSKDLGREERKAIYRAAITRHNELIGSQNDTGPIREPGIGYSKPIRCKPIRYNHKCY